jgi:hypothetical protein
MAVEMAKLSLWLETLQRDKPFTFVDHALRCGDSLVGATVAQLKVWSLDTGVGSHQLGIGSDEVQRLIKEATAKRQELEGFTVNSPADQLRKTLLLQEANARLKDLRDRADLLVSSYLAEVKKSEREDLRNYLLMVANGRADIDDYQRRDLPDLAQLRPFHWELEFPEVFLEGAGFDAIVGNPPFSGIRLFTANVGATYSKFLFDTYKNASGNIYIVIFFFFKAFSLLSNKGYCGLISTKSISEGANKNSVLNFIYKNAKIYRARTNIEWTGNASIIVSCVLFTKIVWKGVCILNDNLCSIISPSLNAEEKEIALENYKLSNQPSLSFRGSDWNGDGFLIEKEDSLRLIKTEKEAYKYIFPCLNYEDFTEHSKQIASRSIIYFGKYEIDLLQKEVPGLVQFLKNRVYEERQLKTEEKLRKKWWLFRRATLDLYEQITNYRDVFVNGFTSKYVCFSMVSAKQIFSNALNVYPNISISHFPILQASIHDVWARDKGSFFGQTLRYTPSSCFETFPFPNLNPAQEQTINDIGKRYYEHRQGIMSATQLGLTKTYNRFHDPNESDPDIEKLRQLHIQMDKTVAKAYQWDDLLIGDGLNHDFHDTKQGLRFTISETARREILDRLLQLNHQRYAEEVAQGLHDKKGKKKASKPQKSVPANQLDLKF